MSTSPMVAMSRAIRHTIEDYTPLNKRNTETPISSLPDDVLEQFVDIVTAFCEDLRGERERRRSFSAQLARSSDEALR